ncbi:6524_t:CDS:2 [Racocetra persica]|uniref:6524_t:CDS:1 n=1 Tax=Racocetra persica TaxID=160502 RepID=A0ACA9S0L4_9GLOM|nr:6524_t:CDS:2 [Racocetra persica]
MLIISETAKKSMKAIWMKWTETILIEDLNFSLEADKMQGLALKMGTKVLDGAVKALSLGTVDPKTSGLADDLKDTTNKYLHNKKGDKSKDERQSERKKTLAAATSSIMQTVLGSVPSLLDASHTHGDYSLGEIALRFDSINF